MIVAVCTLFNEIQVRLPLTDYSMKPRKVCPALYGPYSSLWSEQGSDLGKNAQGALNKRKSPESIISAPYFPLPIAQTAISVSTAPSCLSCCSTGLVSLIWRILVTKLFPEAMAVCLSNCTGRSGSDSHLCLHGVLDRSATHWTDSCQHFGISLWGTSLNAALAD